MFIKAEYIKLVTSLVDGSTAATIPEECEKDLKRSLVSLSVRFLYNDQHFTIDAQHGLRLWSIQFRKTINENTICYFVQEIIGKICEINQVRLLSEKFIPKTSQFLPSAK